MEAAWNINHRIISLWHRFDDYKFVPALRISLPTASSPIWPLHSSSRVDTDSWLVRLWAQKDKHVHLANPLQKSIESQQENVRYFWANKTLKINKRMIILQELIGWGKEDVRKEVSVTTYWWKIVYFKIICTNQSFIIIPGNWGAGGKQQHLISYWLLFQTKSSLFNKHQQSFVFITVPVH